jgi:fructose 5-dehydrogenase cytochrome subunit
MKNHLISMLVGLTICASSLLTAACGSDDKEETGTPNTGSNGQALYKSNCSACHGDTGAGSLGPNITGSTSAGIGSWTAEQFRKAVREGVDESGGTLCTGMPKFATSQVSDADVESIRTYLLTQKSDTANAGSLCP